MALNEADTCRRYVVPGLQEAGWERDPHSISEFKQIIGRGTRVREDYGKLYFSILDYTGSATSHFADPEFDGDPALVTESTIDEVGSVVDEVVVDEQGPTEDEEVIIDRDVELIDPPEIERRKYYVDGGRIEIAHQVVYEFDADGKQLRVVAYTDYTAETVRSLYPTPDELRDAWSLPDDRLAVIETLGERGIDFDHLAEQIGRQDADPFDLLCHVAFNAPLRTRRERAERLRQNKHDLFDQYGPEAKVILCDLLDKYAEHGIEQFRLPDALRVPPISEHGNVGEIIGLFGGADELRSAVATLQQELYSVGD